MLLQRTAVLNLVFIVVLLVILSNGVEGKRSSFGRSRSRPSNSWSSHRPSAHPSPSSLSYPTHQAPISHPSPYPSNTRGLGFDHIPAQRPSSVSALGSHGAVGPPPHGTTNYGFTPVQSKPSDIGFKPSVTQPAHAPTNYGFTPGSSKPPDIGFKPSVTQGHSTGSVGNVASAPPAEHAVYTKPLSSSNSGQPHPYGFKPMDRNHKPNSNTPPPYGFKPSGPVGPPVHSKPVGNTPPGAPYPIQPPPYSPHNPGIPPPAYNPAHNPAGYGPPPAYTTNNNNYGGYGHYSHQPGYSYPQHYAGGSPGVTNININNINTNTHHYGGGGYGGGWGHSYSYPSYHYSTSEVGSGLLGFYLGYSLARITTPTFYSHPTFYNGYTPRYDHYEVHHYYHNRESVPAQSTIQPNTIVGCIGDSGTICPSGTTSLCTSNGAILCVASATSTVPCTDQKQGNCITSVIPCVNGTGDCQVGQNKTVTIPCISKANVPGNITYVNNTIIVNQTTIINNVNGTVFQNGTAPLGNVTSDAISLAQNLTRTRRETVPMNEFCVTVLALPAERKPSEQQQLLNKSASIFSKFLVKALGVQ